MLRSLLCGVLAAGALSLAACSQLVPERGDPEKDLEGQQTVIEHKLPDNIVGHSGYEIDKYWWSRYEDNTLSSLVERAIESNQDLKILLKRVKLARLAVTDREDDQLPKLSSTIAQPVSSTARDRDFQTRTTLTAHVAWEVDLWGRLSALEGAALDEWRATEEEWRGAYLKVINDVANIYFNIRMLDEQETLHRWALKDSEKALSIYTARAEKGLVDKNRIDSQQAEVLRLEADLLDIERQRELLLLQLNLICGETPGQIKLPPEDLTKSIKIPEPPPQIGFDMLLRRPDVIAAGWRLREAYKLERAAQVARYPRLTLDLDYSLSATKLTSLTDNWVLSAMPKISFPALDPATQTELERQGIMLEAKQLEYKKSVLSAVSDLENAIVNLKYRKQQLEVEQARAKALQHSYDATMSRFEKGLISHLEVFEVERSLIHSRQMLLDHTRLVLSETSHLYISLGGGW